MAYMAVQLAAILLLVVGVYRFSRLWVSPRAASIAALASVFLGSESFLVYSAGQLGTTSAAPIYLNALPFFYEWLRYGKISSFFKASILFVAAAAAHHATLLFGSIFFAVPVLVLAFLDREGGERASMSAFAGRTITIAFIVGGAIAIVLLPFWIALIHNPVTQTPIPHPSRANYILSPQWGLNYFIVPYGALILALPYIFIRGSMIARLRPLLLGFWVAFLVGLGGTTPVGHIVLGRAFDVLTMERFSYWATLLALPFVGLLATELIDRYRTVSHCRACSAINLELCDRGRVGNLPACGRRGLQGRLSRFMAQSRRPRPIQVHHPGIRQQDFTPRDDDGCRQCGRRVELGSNASGVDAIRRRGANKFEVFWEAGLGCVTRDADACGPLRIEMGHCAGPLLRSVAFLCWVAPRRLLGRSNHHGVGQGRGAASHTGKCSADSAALARTDVGDPSVRKQHSGNPRGSPSRRET